MHRVTDSESVNSVLRRTTAPGMLRAGKWRRGEVLDVDYNSQHAPRGEREVTQPLVAVTTTPSMPLVLLTAHLFPAQAQSGLDAVRRRRRRRRRRRWRSTRTIRRAAASSLTTARSEVLSPSPLLRPREPGDSGELPSPPALLLPSPSGGSGCVGHGGAC